MNLVKSWKKSMSCMLICLLVFTFCSCGRSKTLDDYLELGAKYLLDGCYEEAIIAFNSAIEIDDKSIEAYLGLADAYHGIKNYEQEIKTLKETVNLATDNAEKSKVLGRIAQASMLKNEGTLVDFNQLSFLGIDGSDFRKYDVVFDTLKNRLSSEYKINHFEDDGDRYIDCTPFDGDLNNYSYSLLTNGEYQFCVQGERDYDGIGVRKLDTGFCDIHTGDMITKVFEQIGIINAEEVLESLNNFWDTTNMPEMVRSLEINGHTLLLYRSDGIHFEVVPENSACTVAFNFYNDTLSLFQFDSRIFHDSNVAGEWE